LMEKISSYSGSCRSQYSVGNDKQVLKAGVESRNVENYMPPFREG
jgi:hypothetical protein